MRITPEQIKTVKTLTHRYFGQDADVWLFGSRVDDKKRGGDYDFFIETSLADPDMIVERKITMIAELQRMSSFEDEKIDLVVKRKDSTFEMPIYGIARHEGVRL